MKRLVSIYIVAVVLLAGCTSPTRPREIIIVPDISASIEQQARRQMFDAIKQVILHLHRGDTVTIIPITGDAEADLQGRILHYEVPTAEKRQAYDADLRRLASRAGTDLDALEVVALARPEQHTDILGTMRIAMAEFSSAQTEKQLIVLSDFIQDDRQSDFRTDSRVSTAARGKRFGTELQKRGAYQSSVRVFLGRLRSTDYALLSAKRREGISAFWQALIPHSAIEPDGPQRLLWENGR